MEILSKNDVCRKFGDCTPRTVERLVERGRLPAPVKIRGRACWDSADVDLALQLMFEEKRKLWYKINHIRR